MKKEPNVKPWGQAVVWRLISILEKLEVENAHYIHGEEVRDYILRLEI